MAQATAPTAPHHVTTVELGERGNADVWIREAGMIDVDMPTRTGGTYTLGSDPLSAGNSADALEAGDNYGYSELSPEAMTALAAALRAGIRAETQHRPDSTEDTQASTSPCPPVVRRRRPCRPLEQPRQGLAGAPPPPVRARRRLLPRGTPR